MEINVLCGLKYCFYNFVFHQCTKCRKSSLVPKTYTYRKENVTYPSGTHALTTVLRWGSGCFTFSFQVVDHCISFRRFLLAIAFIVIETFFEDTKGAKHICESKEDILKWVGKLDKFTLITIDFEKNHIFSIVNGKP